MSYIDAFYKRDEDKVRVVERDAKGQRKFVDYDEWIEEETPCAYNRGSLKTKEEEDIDG